MLDESKTEASRWPSSDEKQDTVLQATITYADGRQGHFFSADGEWFYEHPLPEPSKRTHAMSYERGWLQRLAEQSAQIDSIEVAELPASEGCRR